MSEPYLAHEWDELAALSRTLHAERVSGRARLIGKVGENEADLRIRAMAAVAADWERVSALYAGRSTADRDDTASADQKLATLDLAFARTSVQLERSRRLLHDVLPEKLRKMIAATDVSREALEAAVTIQACPELHHFLHFERRHWGVEALLWHARHPRSAMFFAELTAEMRGRAREAEAA